jgi:predicted SprT family Zn-dependent metalloprotease
MKGLGTIRTACDLLGELANVGAAIEKWAPHRRAEIESVPVFINGRLKRHAGRTHYHRRPCDSVFKATHIDLNRALLSNREELRQTLLHEVAHVIAGAECHHGGAFAHVVRALGEPVRTAAKFESLANNGKVVAVCERCDAELIRHRRLPRSRSFIHKGCGGTFIPSTL